MSILPIVLDELVQAGWNLTDQPGYERWQKRVCAFLQTGLTPNAAERFVEAVKGIQPWEWGDMREIQIGHLQGLALSLAAEAQSQYAKAYVNPKPISAKDVFVVHGHDVETKESVARFLEKVELNPIILHEQPNAGRTIIEKFETFSNVGFAVVLLTPDDVGAAVDNKDNLRMRARQNVILELGYFTGKLGRQRVCPLYKSDVDIPSDFQGVIYTPIDPAGAWKTKLAQELVEAGFHINLKALLTA